MNRRVVLLGSGLLLGLQPLCAQQTNAQATYPLKPTAKTLAWGYYNAKAPVLRVKLEDTLEIQTLITTSPKRL